MLSLVLIYVSPQLAIAAALGTAAVVYFSNRISHLFYFLILYLPLEEFVLKWVDYSIYPVLRYGLELVIYLVLLKIVFEKLSRSEKLVSSPIDLPLLLLAGLGMISTLLNGIPVMLGILGLRPLLRYAAIFYVILNSNLSERQLPRFFKLMIVIAILEIGIGLFQYAIGQPANELLRPKDLIVGQTIIDAREEWQDWFTGQKIFGTLGRYNLLGAFLAGILTIFLGYRFEKGSLNFKEGLFLAAGLAALVLTYSRLSWIGFLAALATLLLIRKKRSLLVALSIAGAILLLPLLSASTSLYQSEVQGSLKDRILGPFSSDYWQMSRSSQRLFVVSEVASQVSGANLLWGFGPGTMGSLVTNLQEGVSRLDQIGNPKKLLIIGDVGWITLMGQMGLLGVGLLVWVLVILFRESLWSYRNSNQFWLRSFSLGLCGYIIALVAMNFFSLAFEARVSSAYFWILAGCVMKCAPKEKILLSQGQQ
jgi:hypothetical protein